MADEIRRDRWGRPMVINPATGREEAYTRISTVAGELDSAHALTAWKMRNAAAGLMQSEHLRAQFEKAGTPQDEDRILDLAIDAAGGNAKREFGSAVHDAIRWLNAGTPELTPDFLKPDIDAYLAATAGVKWLEQEAFGVVHQYALAGSWDAKGLCPDGKTRVFDLKTGKVHAQKCRIQLAAYQMAVNYPDGETVGCDDAEGVVINLPGDGTCVLYSVDLKLGREELAFALALRQHRAYARSERVTVLSWAEQEGWLEELIAAAPDKATCKRLWADHKAIWNAELTGLVNARLMVIEGEARV